MLCPGFYYGISLEAILERTIKESIAYIIKRILECATSIRAQVIVDRVVNYSIEGRYGQLIEDCKI